MKQESDRPIPAEHGDDRTIVVVGPCAAGKSTLAAGLRKHGYRAHTVAQEHSVIRDLWMKQDPDVLITLDLDLDSVRQRRSPTWSADIYEKQHERLKPAFDAADLHIDTGTHDTETALRMAMDFLQTTR